MQRLKSFYSICLIYQRCTSLAGTFCGWVCLLTLTPLLPLLPLQGAFALDLDLGPQPGTTLLAATNTLLAQPVLIDPQLLPQVSQNREHLVVLRQADQRTLAQALASQLDCWWAIIPDQQLDRIILSQDQQMLSQRWLDLPHDQQILTSALIHQDVAADHIIQLLDPWLASPFGIAYHGALGRFAVNMPEPGIAQTIQLLGAIDLGQTRLPPQLTHPGRPASWQTVRIPQLPDWTSWARWVSEAAECSIHLSSELLQRDLTPPTIDQITIEDLPRWLADQGIFSHWRHGLLHLSLLAPERDRQLPIQQARAVIFPLVGQDAASKEQFITAFKESIAIPPAISAFGLIVFTELDRLLLIADSETLYQAERWLRKWVEQPLLRDQLLRDQLKVSP